MSILVKAKINEPNIHLGLSILVKAKINEPNIK